jgi:hypothetical protein
MRKVLFFCFLAAAATAALADTTLLSDTVRVPDVYQFQRTSASLQISNAGKKPVSITKVRALRPTDRVVAFPARIAPGESVKIDVEIDATNDIGTSVHTFQVQTENAANDVIARVTIHVQSALDNGRPIVDFGPVTVSAADPAHAVFELKSEDIPGLVVEEILETPSFVQARIEPGKRSVRLTLDKVPYYGIHRANLKLKLNSDVQSQAWSEIIADVRGDVVPAANPFPLDLVLANKPNEYLLVLRHQGQSEFVVGKPSFERIKGKAKIEPCAVKSDDCKQVRFSIAKDNVPGRLSGAMVIPQGKGQLPIKVELYGMMLKDDSKIVKLDGDKLLARAAEVNSEEGKTKQPFVTQLKGALDTRDKTINLPEPEGKGPLLRWQAEKHLSVHGYAIYRASSEQGPYERLTREVIAQVMPEEGGSVNYAWRDNSATSGKQYWYYVGAVMNNGSKQKISPPMAVTAK